MSDAEAHKPSGLDARRVRRRIYAFSFVDEFGPLYALYAVWFAANGLSAAQISTVFLAWAVFGLVAEVPSGALADRVDRRRLVAFALLLRGVGIGVWLVWPTYPGILIGAALWAIHSAFASGAWEALIHDQLDAVGEREAYGTVMARVGQASQGGVAAGIAVATGLLAVGLDIPALGWLTIAVHVPAMIMILALPRLARDAEVADDNSLAAWFRTLGEGLRASKGSSTVVWLLLIGALLEGLFILDEYQPLLGKARGADDTIVPLLVLAVWLGLIAGGEVAARRPKMRSLVVGLALVLGAGCAAFGVLAGSVWSLLALGVGYAAQNVAWIIMDARFQAEVADDVRATVTSVRAFLGGLLNAAAFGVVGWLAPGDDPSLGVLVLIGVLAAVGAAIAVRRTPAARDHRQPEAD